MKHKHYDLIVAWANGAKVEIRPNCDSEWYIEDYPNWYVENEYRIYHEPKVEVKYFKVDMNFIGTYYIEFIPDLEEWDLKITYKDNKITRVEFPI